MAVSPPPPSSQPHHAQTHANNNSLTAAHSGTGTTAGSSSNTSVSATPTKSSIRIVFSQGGSTCLLRPNAVVRGHVELKLIKPCYAAGIRVKLRAEESAIVLGQESNGDSLRQKFQQTVITLFDTEVMAWGSNQTENELSNWQEIGPGSYAYPFALKVPNVNFPPCIPSLEGFSIRYVWTAHVDGPFVPTFNSDDVLCQYMPNVLAPKPMEWTYRDTVGALVAKGGSTHQLHKAQPSGISVSIKMHQQIYVPGDPLLMATTLVNNGQNKVVGIDIILRRTIKGVVSTSYANLSKEAQVEIMSESVECKVRPGETGQVDIMTTIPPTGKTYSIPTFESNFLKVFYELLCVIRVKRSVFSGGDTSYQCAIPIPIATHNVDNPMITGHTPRWTTSRMQPYFFDPTWQDPVGDIPAQLLTEAVAGVPLPTATVIPLSADSPSGAISLASASASSLLASTVTTTSAMQEFLNSGSAELHRERTLKKSLSRSKSLKDVQSSRLNGSSWRAERELLLNQSREMSSQGIHLNRSTTDVSHSTLGQQHLGQGTSSSKRSPLLGPKSRTNTSEDKASSSVLPGGPSLVSVDNYGYVGYTPPPPTANTRPTKSANRELSAEQQAELARKASRRILPNQGSYTTEGIPAQEPVISTAAANPPTEPTYSYSTGTSNNNSNNNSNNTSSSTHRLPPKRNASLSQKSNGSYQQDLESSGPVPRDNSALMYESGNISMSNTGNRGRPNNIGYGQDQMNPNSNASAHDRVPYQHSLPAHQQPPGVISTSSTTPPLAIAQVTMSPISTTLRERSPSRRENGSASPLPSNTGVTAGDYLPPPPIFHKASSSSSAVSPAKEPSTDRGRHHQRQGSSSSGNSGSNGHGNNTTTVTMAPSMRIPPWERVEKVHHQNWFRPGPHQTGALQVFDAVGVTASGVQTVPIMKRTLQPSIAPVRSIEVEEQLR